MANKNIFCAVPWHNSHMYWDGTYGACCSEQTKPRGPEKNLADTDFRNWYNSQAMRDFRLRILGDSRLPECEGCYREENYGHESRRIKENYKVAIFTEQAFEKSFQMSPWHDKFQSATTTGETDSLPIDLHIDFGNECNLACKMCFPAASSRIAQQYNKWNIAVDKKSNWTNSDILYQKFLNSIQNISKLHRIHIMGGEPLINKRFHDFVDWLINNNYNNLSLSFVSNGTVINEELIKKFKFFKSVDIEISLESVNDNNHYIRQGSDTSKVLENLNVLLKHRSANFNIVLRSVPQLLNVNNYYKYILFAYQEKISIQSIPLINPDYLAINVLPVGLRYTLVSKYQQVKQTISANLTDMSTLTTGRDTSRLEQQLIRECDTIISMLQAPEPNNVHELRKKLIHWLVKWDQVFKLNALEFYPEYQCFLNDYGYSI